MSFQNIYGTFKCIVESKKIVMMMKTCYLMKKAKIATRKQMRFSVLAKVKGYKDAM